ncbi:MAG: hypothetical protein BMS9Abin37_0845 [Acidobacteriota bacterium]|nr:MAG: hypothetical protein BMS9Abin37_0845 [Acidobacteriota bacterium]
MTDNDRSLREHLAKLLDGRQAHVEMATAIDKLAFDDLSNKPEGTPWTLWELFEHIRIAQWDILEFSKSAEHQSPEFPKGYWPESTTPQDADAWEQSVASFRCDLSAMKELVLDPEVDLHAKIPHGDGQTILREAMLVAEHNTYHLGQMVLVMKMLGRW